KPLESQLMIPAELHRAVMELAPEARRDRATVNQTAARVPDPERRTLEGDRWPSCVGAATETNLARVARRLAIALSLYPSGLIRFAISSQEPRPQPGWRRPASRASARPCSTQPVPCRPPAGGVHAPSASRPPPSPVQHRGASVPVRRRERPFAPQPCRQGDRKASSALGLS